MDTFSAKQTKQNFSLPHKDIPSYPSLNLRYRAKGNYDEKRLSMGGVKMRVPMFCLFYKNTSTIYLKNKYLHCFYILYTFMLQNNNMIYTIIIHIHIMIENPNHYTSHFQHNRHNTETRKLPPAKRQKNIPYFIWNIEKISL